MLIRTTVNKFFVLIAIILFVSCKNDNTIWQENKSIPECKWNKDKILTFNIPVEDTVSLFSFSINLRNRTDYSYQNLYLFIKTKAPNGGITIDTLNYKLANEDGSWIGNGGIFSKYREKTYLYRKYIKFPVKGDYIVTIQQGMREEELTGIASVSLNLNYSL